MMTKRVDVLDEVSRMPDFVVALRPHTVWEKTPVKLFCTVQGNPRPIVKWSEHPHLTGAGFHILMSEQANRAAASCIISALKQKNARVAKPSKHF